MIPTATNHPNAEVSVYTGALAVIVLYLASLAGVSPPAEVGAALSTVFTGLALLLGRRSRK